MHLLREEHSTDSESLFQPLSTDSNHDLTRELDILDWSGITDHKADSKHAAFSESLNRRQLCTLKWR